jgi:hypothetical protein
MKLSCPRCAQRIDLDLETLDSLAGESSFGCPACGGEVPLPHESRDGNAAPSLDSGKPPVPDIAEISRSFDSRYQIKRLIGRGGMGAVYEGFDTRLDRRVAIKILPGGSDSKPGALVRFEREAKAMAALDHPNIVQIHDYGQTPDGNPYFVMEFIDGMDVHHLRHSGQLNLAGALDLVSQVCSALQYAHSRGIVHRDIKPGNILVNRDGVAKVADFGLAKVLGSEDQPHHDPTLTQSGTAVGTPDYMAPEQFDGSHVDHRADIYSLGVMLYDLLTGSPPRGAWPPPSQRVQIDVRLDEIVLRALQQNPSARYQAASEVRADIDSVKITTGGGPLPPGVDPAPLPSRIASSAAIQAAPANSRAAPSVKIRAEEHPERASDANHVSGGLGSTMLVLGLLAIAILGGLAFFLANRGGSPNHGNQTLVENTNIHRDVPPGLTADDLKEVGDIWFGPHGFIGVSMQAIDWEQAAALAKRTGAEILSVDESDPAWSSRHGWLRDHFAVPLAMQTWVLSQGKSHLLDPQQIVAPELANPSSGHPRHKVLLYWPSGNTALPVPQNKSDNPAPATGDWIVLFDGADVSRWKGSKDPDFPDDSWGIEDGALRNFHGTNDQNLETRERYQNFELEFEWKLSAGGNSGIFYGQIFHGQREFQLVDDAGHHNGKVPVTSCGALCYFIPPNENKKLQPAGEYNRGKLIVRGNQVEHWINGQKVVEYELASPNLKSLASAGQFKNLPGYKELDTEAGEVPITLQSHAGNVWFRNIRIRKLDGTTSSKSLESGSSSRQESFAQGSRAGVDASGPHGVSSEWVPLDISAACSVDLVSTDTHTAADQFTYSGSRLASASWLRKNNFPEPGLPDDGRVAIPETQPPAYFEVRMPPAKNAMILSGPEGTQPQPITIELAGDGRRHYSELAFLHCTCWGNGTLRVSLRYESGEPESVTIPVADWAPTDIKGNQMRAGPLPAELHVAVTSRNIHPIGGTVEMLAQRIPTDPERKLHSLTLSVATLTGPMGIPTKGNLQGFKVALFAISARTTGSSSQQAASTSPRGQIERNGAKVENPNLDYGLLISYGMQTFTGPATGQEPTEGDASRFAPADVNVKSWTRLAKEAGMSHAIMNVKHSSGFRLWDAPFDDYDLGGCPYQGDVLAEFIENCATEGLLPGVNYVVTDVHREGAYRRKEPVTTTHMKLIKQELGDLLTRYTGLRVLVFGHFGRFSPQEDAEIRTLVQTLNPKCVILDDAPSGNTYQPVSTVKGWFLTSAQAEMPTMEELSKEVRKWRNQGVPLLINVGPDRAGQIPREQRDLLIKLRDLQLSTTHPSVIPRGSIPWTNTDGVTIQAEFIRLDGQSVVILKDGMEFILPLAKLSPESRKQAQDLASSRISAPE